MITSYAESALKAVPAGLSEREHEVLGHLQLGLTNREIGHRLYISTNTVNKHVQQILKKLRVRNRVEAAVSARNVAG